MNDTLLPILVAVTVILLIWGVFQLFGGLNDHKKRLQQRLSGDGKLSQGFDPATFTVVRRQATISGTSGVLARLPGMRTVASHLMQTWPSISLAKFLFLSLSAGV